MLALINVVNQHPARLLLGWATTYRQVNCLLYCKFTAEYNSEEILTRKLCYRKDDRAMRPIHGRPEKFRDSLTTPTATIPNIVHACFCSDRPSECSYQI